MRALLFAVVMAAACASARSSSYGVVSMRDLAGPGAPPGTLQVGDGRVAGDNIDIREEDGCVRGFWGKHLVNYCQDAATPQHWAGPDGDFTLSPNGSMLDVTGTMLRGGATMPINETFPLGRAGKGWDELRRHPALMVVTSYLVGLPH